MEWLLYPAVLSVLAILFGIWACRIPDKNWEQIGSFKIVVWTVFLVIGLLAICSWVLFPAGFYDTKNSTKIFEAYYDNLIQPNVVEETESYVVVDSIQTAFWQSGKTNVTAYNNFLTVNRYWDSHPIAGRGIYPVPDRLKLVRIVQEGRS